MHSYLTNRTFSVKVKYSVSSPRPILAGVPQGGILSATLFNLYVNDIPQTPSVDLALYADDTAIISQHSTLHATLNHLQLYLTDLESWLITWKIKINVAKSAATVFFSRKRNVHSQLPPLRLFEENVPWVESYKYLGVYLDAKLLWNTHINYAISKARNTRTQLMSLLKRTSNLSLNNKILLYKSTILPILTYAAVVWSTAANSHLKKIQVFQSVTLRILTNAHYFVRNEVLHNDLKILPLDAFFRQNSAKFFNRLTQIENPVLHSLPAYDPAEPSSAKRPRSVLDRTYNIFPRKPKRRCLLD